MNKKQLIDSFESLTPSVSQKERMLKNILDSGMKKEIHSEHRTDAFRFRYVFTTAAAAVCAVAVIVTVGPWYNKQDLSQTPVNDSAGSVTYEDSTIIAADDSDNTPSQKTNTDDAVADTGNVQGSHSASPDTAYSLTEEEVVSAPEQPREEKMQAGGNMKEESIEASSDKAATKDAAGEMPLLMQQDSYFASENNMLPELHINALESNNSLNAVTQKAEADTVKTDDAPEIMTIEDYYIYLGVNVEDKLSIPKGFSAKVSQERQIDKDTDDVWFFEYEKGDSYIRVKTTKHTGNLAVFLEDDELTPSDINGTKAVVIQSGNNFCAYIVCDDIGYTINTINVSQADLTNLLVSIAE